MRKALLIAASLFYAFFAATFAGPVAAEPVNVNIGVSDNLGPRISRIMEEHPDVCEQDDFFSDQWLRTSLEFVLVCRAIRLGGLEATYTIYSFPNSARTRGELLAGRVAIMVDLPWNDFAQHEDLYQSDAVLRVGDFVKGIYTRPDHTELLKVRTLEELRKFTAVSSDTWVYDWAALQRMNITTSTVSRYELMGRMVEKGRADFLVGEFPGASDLSQYINGFRFVPVPGIKIALPGSRHVAISKRAPHAKQIFDAVQIGLKILRDRGLIKKGYQTVGFLNPLIETWKVLCCEDVS
ncbi:ABC transporter substrate-binding protein [Pelagibius marinus]|uniref:ABC transporter substrate-binding protein n=1 Tax=Pelagibius marinus TaxID=2762760 RepID=UPI001872727A|nr:ABC transporter substrate-binding protein [Pelagibius marinus]